MRMLTRTATVWAAVSGLVGMCMLGISFAINTGPPAGASGAQLAAFGQQHHDAILWGAWLQAAGPALIAVFALAIVVLAGATARLAGWMTVFGAATLMTVSVIEITGYIGTVHTSSATMPATSLALIHSVQHLWFIVGAPALWLPLGLVILGSHVLPGSWESWRSPWPLSSRSPGPSPSSTPPSRPLCRYSGVSRRYGGWPQQAHSSSASAGHGTEGRL
jgi:hypothetical protein